MSVESCLVPMRTPGLESAAADRMLRAKRIAIVGMSDNATRPSNGIGGYLISHGYDIVPVNPNYRSIMGRTCYPTLADVPGVIEIVNVFRRSEFCADVVRYAIAIGAKGVWLQSGIRNIEACQLAADANIDYVEDRCIMVEHMQRRQ